MSKGDIELENKAYIGKIRTQSQHSPSSVLSVAAATSITTSITTVSLSLGHAHEIDNQ